MRKILTLCFLSFLIFQSSCKKVESFLDKAPGVDIDENTIFSSKTQLESFMATVYRYGINSGFGQRSNTINITTTGASGSSYAMLAGATDEAENEASFVHTNAYLNAGGVTPQNIIQAEDFRYNTRWILVRYVAIVLERLKDVPNLTPDYINQITGEVKFLRALNYFEMIKRYGGVMLVKKRFNVGEEVNVPRSSLEDTFNFIFEDLNSAIELLPNSYPSNLYGRATKGAALLLKSRALLYAASPLFNTTTPYLQFGANNKLICFGNYDANRWKLAADAAKAVLDWASGNGIKLVTDQGVDKNYKYSWETPANPEIILAEQFQGTLNADTFPWYCLWPVCMGGSWTGVEVLQNHVAKYEKLDGTPMDWPATGGNDIMSKYAQLDLRFKQTVAYNGTYWNKDYTSISTYSGGAQARAANGVFTGAWMKKFWPDALAKSVPGVPNWVVLRLNEAYLNYAEALNEALGPVGEAYQAVNTIRARSGMPALPAGLSQDQFRKRVRNERDIELAFEEHRFFDIRRWMIAENDGVMQGNMYGVSITKNGNLYNWVPVLIETRTFQHSFYLNPFPYNEVLKGNLIQNPGW